MHPGRKPCAPQARALGRMLAIDDGAVGFTEQEMSDHALASGIGWTLKVKAMRAQPLPQPQPQPSPLTLHPHPQPLTLTLNP